MWNLRFRRALFQWESDQLSILQQRLTEVTIHNQGEDQLKWRWVQCSGNFSVQSCFGKWEQVSNATNPICPKCMLVWKNICPFKVEIFTWQAIQDKLATGSELIKRNILHQGERLMGICPFCQNEIETAVHLLIQCPISWRVWSQMMRWWEIEWVCPFDIYELMCYWASFYYKNVECFGHYGCKGIILFLETKLLMKWTL